MSARRPLLERFAEKYIPEPNTGCWLWTGAVSSRGYGQIHSGPGRDSGRLLYAHRVSYEMEYGPIGAGLELDHLCRVPCCINPRHLRAVTHKENMNARGSLVGLFKTVGSTCRRGHPFIGDNLYIKPDGRRECRTCMRERERNRVRN